MLRSIQDSPWHYALYKHLRQDKWANLPAHQEDSHQLHVWSPELSKHCAKFRFPNCCMRVWARCGLFHQRCPRICKSKPITDQEIWMLGKIWKMWAGSNKAFLRGKKSDREKQRKTFIRKGEVSGWIGRRRTKKPWQDGPSKATRPLESCATCSAHLDHGHSPPRAWPCLASHMPWHSARDCSPSCHFGPPRPFGELGVKPVEYVHSSLQRWGVSALVCHTYVRLQVHPPVTSEPCPSAQQHKHHAKHFAGPMRLLTASWAWVSFLPSSYGCWSFLPKTSCKQKESKKT